MTEIDVSNYLKTLAPDFAILDNVEQYAIQHNKSGFFGGNNFFFYKENASQEKINVRRFLCRYTGTCSSCDDSYICRTYTYRNKQNIAIFISDEEFPLPAGIGDVCGVAF